MILLLRHDHSEEGQELWGVYVFKRDFGSYAMRFLETHNPIYQSLVYNVYMRLLEVKRRRGGKRQHRNTRQVSHPTSSEKAQLWLRNRAETSKSPCSDRRT